MRESDDKVRAPSLWPGTQTQIPGRSRGCGGWRQIHMTQPRSRVKVEMVGLATALVGCVPVLAMEVVEWKHTPNQLYLLPHAFNL